MKLKMRIAAALTAAIVCAGTFTFPVYAQTETAPEETSAVSETADALRENSGEEASGETPEEAADDKDDPEKPAEPEITTPYLGIGALSGGYNCYREVVSKGDIIFVETITYIPIENFEYGLNPNDFYSCNIFAVSGDTTNFRFASTDAQDVVLKIVGSFLCVSATFKNVTYLGGGNTFGYTICYNSKGQSVSTSLSVTISECTQEKQEDEEVPAIFALGDSRSCTVKAGQSANVVVNLKRINSGSFSSITASLSSSDTAVVVEDTGTKTSSSSVPQFSFRVSSPKTAAAGNYTLTLSTVVYGKDGALSSQNSYNINVTVTSDVVSSGLNVSSYKISKEPVKSGDSFTLSLTLENKCNVDLQDVKVSLDGLDAAKFVLDGGFSAKSVSIRSGQSQTVMFRLVACSGISSVRETIPVTAQYRIDPADAGTAQTLTTSVIAECKPEGEKQEVGKYDITMTNYSFSSSEIKAGTKFNFTFTLKNVSKNDITDGRVSVMELNGTKFAIDSGLSYANFSLKAGASRVFSFPLIGCDGISSIRETISVEISFGQQTSTAYATVTCVPPEKADDPELGKHDITMTAYKVSSASVQSGTRFTLEVTLRNNAQKDIKGVRAAIAELSNGKFAIDSGLSYADFDIAAGESKTFVFPLVGCDGISSIRETIPIEISFGTQSSTDYATVTCVPKEKQEDSEDSFAPAIIIESYDFGGDHVTGGTIFPLNIVIANTGSSAVIENLKVTISGGAGNGNNGVAFSPANSSNSFFIERLGPKASELISIELLPRADAAPDSYPVNVDFSYEYLISGKRHKAPSLAETITIPLQQEDRFTINNPDFPETVGMGEVAYISASFVNKGKSDVYNVTADIEGEGFNKNSGAYYIGNVASGSEEYYDVQIVPFDEGEISAEIVVTYEDANGTQKEQRVPIMISVVNYNYGGMDYIYDAYGPGGMEDFGEETEGGLTWLWFVIGGAVVLIIVIIIIVAAVKKKKKRELEQDDEDQ